MVDEDKIVVGVDGSASSSRALQWAMKTAVQYDEDVEAVMAWEWGFPTFGVRSSSTPVEVAVEAAHAVEGQVSEALADRQVDAVQPRVTGRAMEGDPATVLTSLPASLLVLGQHGQSAIRRRLLGPALGSVASHCLSNATVPVVIVPVEAAPGLPTRIVVGLDGSPSSGRALRWAVAYGHAVGAPVTAAYGFQMTTMPWPERAPDDLSRTVPPLSSWQRDAERWLQEWVSHALPAAEAANVALLTLHQPAAAGLLSTVHEDDVLVLGERGQGGFRRLLLGSVSRHCAEYAPCPVVVVPPGLRGQRTGGPSALAAGYVPQEVQGSTTTS